MTGEPGGRRWRSAWARDSAVVLLSQVTNIAAAWLIVVLLARGLGPSEFGLFSGLYGLSQALAMVVDFGLATYLVRELTALDLHHAAPDQVRRRASALLAEGLGISVAIALPLLAVAGIAAVTAGWSAMLTAGILGLMAYTFLIAAATIFEAAFRSTRDYRAAVGVVFLEKVVLLAAVAVTLALGGGIAALALCYLAVGLLRLLIARAWLGRRLRITLRVPSGAAVRATARRAAPFAFNRASLTLAARLDVALIALISTTYAAYYAIGDRTNTMLLIGAMALTSTLYPFFEGSPAARVRRSLRVASITSAAGVAACAIGIVFAPQILRLAFGDAFVDATATLRVMLLAVPLAFGANAVLAGLYSAGSERVVAILSGVASAAGTVAVVSGAVVWGAEGAAVGYVARQALVALLLGLVASRILRSERFVP